MSNVRFSAFQATSTLPLGVAAPGQFRNTKSHGFRYVILADRAFHAARGEQAGVSLVFDDCPLFRADTYFEIWLEPNQYLTFQAAAGETDGEIRITEAP